MALDRIKNTDKFIVDQETNWFEGCLKCCGVCCADFENTYSLYANNEKKPFITIKEDSSCMGRAMCNPNHEMKLDWKAQSGGPILLEMRKPFKWCCPAICPCFQKEMELYRMQPAEKKIGKVKQPWLAGGLRPEMHMFDGQDQQVGTVNGPCCCIGACCSSQWDFKDNNGKEHVKMKRGGMADVGIARSAGSNSDRYEITFEDQTMNIDEKISVIGTVIFIDYLFFEGETNCTCVWCQYTPPFLVCPPQLWFKICDLYCCGSTIPIKCKCCIDDAVEGAAKTQTGGVL
jgi:hypothetical protein